MGDEARCAGARTFPQRAIAFLRHHDYSITAAPSYMLWFTVQRCLDNLTELRFCVLKTPLRFVHSHS